MGEAIATPIDKANHTSTKRAISLALRSCCMVTLLQFCIWQVNYLCLLDGCNWEPLAQRPIFPCTRFLSQIAFFPGEATGTFVYIYASRSRERPLHYHVLWARRPCNWNGLPLASQNHGTYLVSATRAACHAG
jgi:hypothetical protein